MGLSREVLERQLSSATDKLSKYEAKLDEKGVDAKDREKNTIWRNLKADVRKVKNRLNAVAGVEAREAEAAKRKEEKSSAE